MTDPSQACLDEPVFLLGMPRSGTTWLSQIVESAPEAIVRLSPNYAYPLKNRLSAASTAAEWRAVLAHALATDDPFMTQNWRRDSGDLVRFPKARVAGRPILFVKDTRFHGHYRVAMDRLPRAKCVYIVRHPAASLHSWRRSPEFPEGAAFEAEWRSGACRKGTGSGEYWGFDDWKALTLDYQACCLRNPDRYLVLRYEDLVGNARREAARVFAFCGLALGAPTEAFIRESQSRDEPGAYSVFRQKDVAGRWRRDFPADILGRIEADLAETPLAVFLR